jgi:hypothetical protein
VGDRRRLPWLISVPLIVGGSFGAHWLGSLMFAPRGASAVDPDGGVELAQRVDHGYVTVVPLLAGVAIAIALVCLAVRVRRAFLGRRSGGVSPLWFLALPFLGFAVQELAERALHAEAVPFNPAHEPAFLSGLVLQLPFGLLAYIIGRALLGLSAKLARILSGSCPFFAVSRPATVRPVQVVLSRIPVLGLGHSVRGPPLIPVVV